MFSSEFNAGGGLYEKPEEYMEGDMDVSMEIQDPIVLSSFSYDHPIDEPILSREEFKRQQHSPNALPSMILKESLKLVNTPEPLDEVFSVQPMETSTDLKYRNVIVLDGANIGWNYGIDEFKAKGIKIACDYFSKFNGLRVVTFIPTSNTFT